MNRWTKKKQKRRASSLVDSYLISRGNLFFETFQKFENLRRVQWSEGEVSESKAINARSDCFSLKSFISLTTHYHNERERVRKCPNNEWCITLQFHFLCNVFGWACFITCCFETKLLLTLLGKVRMIWKSSRKKSVLVVKVFARWHWH